MATLKPGCCARRAISSRIAQLPASALGVRHGQAEEQAHDHPKPEAGDEAHRGALNVVFAPADADGNSGGASLSGVEGEGRDSGGFGG